MNKVQQFLTEQYETKCKNNLPTAFDFMILIGKDYKKSLNICHDDMVDEIDRFVNYNPELFVNDKPVFIAYSDRDTADGEFKVYYEDEDRTEIWSGDIELFEIPEEILINEKNNYIRADIDTSANKVTIKSIPVFVIDHAAKVLGLLDYHVLDMWVDGEEIPTAPDDYAKSDSDSHSWMDENPGQSRHG